ncbi:O-methyltransferase [Hansschlegelia plantiphila]|uniref:Uncharacterized protein n=1 Tax=Hansschlegelia plantiphila TaxID=374655 RepID=A0A9W6J4Q1_9HYPH|nr:class I SAM-dependent methyltransferase [Hansschlegelia plantiphila]GLK69708.1 hypothetical protein GCM10008179_33460 [Hansschlegelia plantiphila]
MIEKFRTALWFAQRPSHWAQAMELGARMFRPDRDGPVEAAKARAWAGARAVPVAEALAAVGVPGAVPEIDRALIAEAEELGRKAAVAMGGPGDINLLYAAVRLTGARRVVETGVAYGWSSLAILSAFDGMEDRRLVSVDMPYPKMGNDAFVGIVVPERLRAPWTIIREPDRRGLKKAIRAAGGPLDLCHYDSDKSWYGRRYGFPLLWDALAPGGLFVCDDIQDNMAFAEDMERLRAPFAVTAYANKFVGVVRKPGCAGGSKGLASSAAAVATTPAGK